MNSFRESGYSRTRACCDGILDRILSTDFFGHTFHMSLDKGRDEVNSYTGSICSFLVFFLICIYGTLKIDVLIAKKDVDMLSAILDYYYDEGYIFNY